MVQIERFKFDVIRMHGNSASYAQNSSTWHTEIGTGERDNVELLKRFQKYNTFLLVFGGFAMRMILFILLWCGVVSVAQVKF